MNNLSSRIGSPLRTLILCALLSACTSETAQQGAQAVRLPPCSADGSVFAKTDFDEWKDVYHEKVSEAVEAHLKGIDETVNKPLQCTAESYAELVPASEELREIASFLPGYTQNNRVNNVTEADIGPVLLEFLRVYECSMAERRRNLTTLIPQEANESMFMGEFMERKIEDEKTIDEETLIARPALERTLTVLGGYDRMRPLSLDIECIKRASLDLRNVLGLASDASSCLPRVWDTRGSLRDLP